MSYFTTPPPRRAPEPRHPLFTKNPFSTKSWNQGHIVGAGILVFGVAALTKFFVAKSKSEADRDREAIARGPIPVPPKGMLAQTDRGTYQP